MLLCSQTCLALLILVQYFSARCNCDGMNGGIKVVQVSRTFDIDYNNSVFMMDGQPFRYISGSVHYFRVPRQLWSDRLRKLRLAGLNTVCTYVEWSLHEPREGTYEFTGDADLVEFINTAQQEKLYVLLRPGPYICAERDLGGFPGWLQEINPNMELRTSDPTYTHYVKQWFDHLFPILQPLLYGNGGPIIMVQVENEYGSFKACDRNYMRWLRDLILSYVANNALLFTTDGSGQSFLQCGPVYNVLPTVDFGSKFNISTVFDPLRMIYPRGPLVNSEYYAGWLVHWGEKPDNTSAQAVANGLDKILAVGASVNIYMFHGGTNYGYTSGANYDEDNKIYHPTITSYDYGAPLTEAGDPTDKYFAIKKVIAKYENLTHLPDISFSPKGDYGTVVFTTAKPFFDVCCRKEPVWSMDPLTFPEIPQNRGFVIYETEPKGSFSDPALLYVEARDRVYIYLDKVFCGILTRNIITMPLLVRPGQTLRLLVEDQGRINFQSHINEKKGIITDVSLDGHKLFGWRHYGFPELKFKEAIPVNATPDTYAASLHNVQPPVFFFSKFKLPPAMESLDTFINMTGWGKGILWVNNINLGRYWHIGPQMTLYLPHVYLKPYPENNIVSLLELQFVPANKSISFSKKPIWMLP